VLLLGFRPSDDFNGFRGDRDVLPPATLDRARLRAAPRRLSPLLASIALNLAAASATVARSEDGGGASIEATEALRAAVTVDAVLGHLAAFQAIADAHGGNRTAGSPGYDASVDYVAGRLREAGYTVRLETFDLPLFEQLRPPTLTLLAGAGPGRSEALEPRTMEFSGAGTAEGPVWPAGGRNPGADATRGCRAADFEGMPPGAIALARRGDCPLETKVENAVEAGAAGIIVHDRSGEGRSRAFHGHLDGPAAIPAVSLGHAAGMRLAEAARRGVVTARLDVAARTRLHPTRNVIAEAGSGDPERVILVGAHLDSVPAGPGINDNASGAGAVLEIALQIARLGIETTNRLRFAFWGAEEIELNGSNHHASSLTPDERERLRAVLNFDMLGSANHARFVYDGDGSGSEEAGPPGSARIEQLFRAYFAALGLPVTEIALEDASDHLSFVEHGVPVGGLVAGDGELKSAEEAKLFGGTADAPYDPCFHEACDTLGSINRSALDELTDAAAHAVLVLGSEPLE
jgi:Zn-dependent M28 family amino/carboxypeptidase